MYGSVFASTDGSDRSNVVLEHAIDLADTDDATLHTQYVVHSSSAFETDLDEDVEADVYRSLFDAGERAVSDLADRTTNESLPITTGDVPFPERRQLGW